MVQIKPQLNDNDNDNNNKSFYAKVTTLDKIKFDNQVEFLTLTWLFCDHALRKLGYYW